MLPQEQAAKRTTPLTEAKPEAVSLVFFKKGPVTFQIHRKEHPAVFERMAFVVKARSNDPQRKALMVLPVEQIREGSWLVATDGRRLHAALLPLDIKSGDYELVVTKDAIILGEPVAEITFPNWRGVIPGDTTQRGMIDLTDSGWGKDTRQTEKLSVAFNALVRQTGKLINLRYLEDLAKMHWSIHCQREKGKALLLKAEGVKEELFAVIMPLNEETVANAA